MERPRSGTEQTPCWPSRSSTPTSRPRYSRIGHETAPNPLSPYFRIADFTSEPKAYRARNRRFESISLQRVSAANLLLRAFERPPMAQVVLPQARGDADCGGR